MFSDVKESDVQGARALGWASLGLGLAELAAPKRIEKLLGIEDRVDYRAIVRVLGVRELMHGLGILSEHRNSPGKLASAVGSRVAGDVLDTAMLAAAATRTRNPARFAGVAAAILGIGLIDSYFARRLSRA